MVERKLRLILILVCAGALLGVVGCSSEDEPSADSSSAESPVPATTRPVQASQTDGESTLGASTQQIAQNKAGGKGSDGLGVDAGVTEVPPIAVTTDTIPQAEDRETALTEEMKLVDANRDEFPTEVLNESGGKALKELVHAMEAGATAQTVALVSSDAFTSRGLIPSDLTTEFDRDGVRIERGERYDSAHQSFAGLADALNRLFAAYDGREFEVKFKIERVERLSETQATTGVIYLAMGTGPKGNVQQNANWLVSWDVSQGMDHPKITGIAVSDFEQIIVPQRIFSDCTESAPSSSGAFEQIHRGIDELWGKIDVGMGFSFYGDYGLAIGDINNDGLDDLYLCQPGGMPNLLLRHNRDGSLTDISVASGTNMLNETISAIVADFNNDGNQDLAIAMSSHIAIMRGDGKGRFVTASGLTTQNTMSLSAVDYDNDGRLDIYVCRYGSNRSGASSSLFDSSLGTPNVLWRNQGAMSFRDVTAESGIDHNNRRYSFASVWEDYDNDGDMDVYVANDFGRNNLYRNDNGQFQDVAATAGVEDQAFGMGASWADFNQDGWMDLYVSNMFSSAGGRVTYQRNFTTGRVGDVAAEAQHSARGNTLFENQGDGTFRDVSVDAGVTMGRWSWARNSSI